MFVLFRELHFGGAGMAKPIFAHASIPKDCSGLASGTHQNIEGNFYLHSLRNRVSVGQNDLASSLSMARLTPAGFRPYHD